MKMLKKINSIRLEMLISFSTLIVIALFIFLVISLNYTEKTILENSKNYSTKLIEQVNYQIESYIDYMENITVLVTSHEDVNEYLFNEDLTTEEKDFLEEGILTQFRIIVDARKDIYNIGILSGNGRYLLNDGKDILNTNIELSDLDWYNEALLNPDETLLSNSHVQNLIMDDYKWVITLAINMRNPYTNESAGFFFIDLNYSAIIDLSEDNKMSQKGYIFILDENGNIIYHPKQQLLYSGLKRERIEEVLENKTGHFITNEDNGKLYTISVSDKTSWTIVGVEEISELMQDKAQTQIIYIIAAFILLTLAVLISAIISKSISKPIKVLRDSMKLVEQGEFANASIESISNNEIGNLSISFNVMLNEIRNLMDRIVYEQKEKRKSELRVLQSQINPHFLYNTLDSIIWMAEAKKTEEVVIMTSSLAKLLRQSISNEDEELSIAQEKNYIESYLTIQQMRYKDILDYIIEFDKEINNEKILKLSVQPIVENAIYHGLKPKQTKGLIKVVGYSVGHEIIIKVIDNGVGMTEEQITNVFDINKSNNKSKGIGIYNVQRRLLLHYGIGYGVKLESKVDEGTVVTITIPKKREDV